MKRLHYIKIAVLVAMITGMQWPAAAQDEISRIKISGDAVVITIDRTGEAWLVDSICRSFGSDIATIDSLWNQESQREICTEQEWCVQEFSEKEVVFVKRLDALSNNWQWSEGPVLVDDDWIGFAGDPLWQEPIYGINDFKKKTVESLANGQTRFSLPGHEAASRVFLAGSFNNWSTLANLMQRTDTGWTATIALKPGKHLYKFIVDGNWIHDQHNNHQEWDGHGGQNSIYYVYNHVFRLDTLLDAKHIYVAGSFNDWKRKELKMQFTGNGWELPLYLREGTHAYKYRINRRWFLDPNNPVTRPDGNGNYNSFVAIGDTFYFSLKNYAQAEEVIVTGDFNAWNEKELSMTKADSGWVLPYVLAAGNYEYKYIVDGRWMMDSANPHTNGTQEYTNSIMVIDPNHTFRLKGHADAEEVLVSGNFNNWSENGYVMKKTEAGWAMDLHLKPGKYRYKFVVDGKWILDPANELYEENEHGTGNSVLWLDPGREK